MSTSIRQGGQRAELIVPRQREAARQDADDRAGPIVEHDPASDGRRVSAESVLPEAMREHHDGVAAWLVLIGAEHATGGGLDPQQGEQRRSDAGDLDAGRGAAPSERVRFRLNRGQALEGADLRLPEQKPRPRPAGSDTRRHATVPECE